MKPEARNLGFLLATLGRISLVVEIDLRYKLPR